MKHTWKSWIVIAVAVVSLLSCAQPETEMPEPEPTPAAAETGPDPTVADAGHYAVEFENEGVRVLRTAYGPGEESVMHHHPAHVAVFLTDHHLTFELPDGSIEEAHFMAGEHIYVPGGQHLAKNVGQESTEAVIVELKSAGSQAGAAATGPDPTVVDADHYTAEFENEQVRVLRIAYGPGESSVMHHHPDGVAVFLTDHHVAFEFPDGSTDEVHAKAGEHIFVPAGQHLPRNIAEDPWELVLVELKGS